MKFEIPKRRKPEQQMPEPKFEDNWMADKYLQNVKTGVLALQQGNSVKIHDDGRGYELALEIKRQFILEYQKLLSEKIQITAGSEITISFKNAL